MTIGSILFATACAISDPAQCQTFSVDLIGAHAGQCTMISVRPHPAIDHEHWRQGRTWCGPLRDYGDDD